MCSLVVGGMLVGLFMAVLGVCSVAPFLVEKFNDFQDWNRDVLE